jgi:broad specificity phosphatase PhoE
VACNARPGRPRVEERAMDLYLVRHGESNIPSDAIQTDHPLSELGHEQARRVGERFRGVKVDRLITTPYQRTQQTAGHIASVVGVEAVEEPGLGAVLPGELGTTPFSQRKERFPDYYKNPSPLMDYTPFGGEGPQQFYERVAAAFVENIWDRHKDDKTTIVLVCHGETINAVLLHLLGLPFAGWMAFSIDHTSVSFVDVRVGRPRIRYVNDSSHLGGISRGHRGMVGGEAPRYDQRV